MAELHRKSTILLANLLKNRDCRFFVRDMAAGLVDAGLFVCSFTATRTGHSPQTKVTQLGNKFVLCGNSNESTIRWGLIFVAHCPCCW